MKIETPEEFFARRPNRFDNALMIQMGASNMRGVSRTLTEACDEACNEGIQPGKDPAVRLIMHQMCHLAGIVTEDCAPTSGGFNWLYSTYQCCQRASFDTLFLMAEQHDRDRERGRRECVRAA